MLAKKTLQLYWFSGSGNTLRAAEVFSGRLRELGWTVELCSLEKSDPAKIDPMAVFGIAFPTHCFSIPEIVRSFVKSLPKVDGTAAMMLGTHGVFSGGVRGPMKRILTQKGFRCVAARIFSMPDSFFPFCGDETNRRHIEYALEKAKRYAEDFDADKTQWFRLPILSDIHGTVFGMFFASRKLFRGFHTTVHTKSERCTRCDVCVESCPVNALVRQTPDDIPKANMNCVNCLRCVAVCPTDAMRHLIGFHSYRCESAPELKNRFDEALDNSLNFRSDCTI